MWKNQYDTMTLPKYKEIHNKQFHKIMQHVLDDITWQLLVKLYSKKKIYIYIYKYPNQY